MTNLNTDFEKSAKKIFKLFFKSDVAVNKDIMSNCPAWGVDLLMEYNGKKKFSLYIEEKTMKSVLKQLTGNDSLKNRDNVYEIIGEIARFIAGSAIGEHSDNYKLHRPERIALNNDEKKTDFSAAHHLALSVRNIN